MQYDFTSVIDRQGQDALALDAIGLASEIAPSAPMAGYDAIPMWVADMNFPVLPNILHTMQQRISHPMFGYFLPRKEYFDAIIQWHTQRYNSTGLTPAHIGYQNGVLGGVISALNLFCSHGDSVLLHSPTYLGFTNSLTNKGYQIVHSPLVFDEQGIWRMDYADMEQKIIANRIHATVFCSPHNPSGRVWEQWELEKAMAIFQKHDVMVISDEIWADIVMPGHRHIPTQLISDDARNRTIALYAPSKTFNLAGLVGSYHVIYNNLLRDRMEKESSLSHYNHMNVLSMHALIGAYTASGQKWVDELCTVLQDNINTTCSHLQQVAPEIQFSRPQGTYMLYLDCTQWCQKYGKSIDELQQSGWDVGVAWQDGRLFQGTCHIRMNLALPPARLQEALRRLEALVFCTQ